MKYNEIDINVNFQKDKWWKRSYTCNVSQFNPFTYVILVCMIFLLRYISKIFWIEYYEYYASLDNWICKSLDDNLVHLLH